MSKSPEQGPQNPDEPKFIRREHGQLDEVATLKAMGKDKYQQLETNLAARIAAFVNGNKEERLKYLRREQETNAERAKPGYARKIEAIEGMKDYTPGQTDAQHIRYSAEGHALFTVYLTQWNEDGSNSEHRIDDVQYWAFLESLDQEGGGDIESLIHFKVFLDEKIEKYKRNRQEFEELGLNLDDPKLFDE